MPRHSPCALINLTIALLSAALTSFAEKSISGFSSVSELCRLIKKFSLAEIVSITLKKFVSLLLPSHNFSHSLFSFQGTSLSLMRLKEASIKLKLHSISKKMVGQSGLEPPTSRLSVVCSSQLSYWPVWWRLAGSNR